MIQYINDNTIKTDYIYLYVPVLQLDVFDSKEPTGKDHN